MRIGKVYFNSKVPLALAPMAGYTNLAFREMALSMGADIAYTELASAAALANELAKRPNKSETTKRIIRTSKKGVSGIQIFGAEKEEIIGAIKFIENEIHAGRNYAKFIDLNLGCPASKIAMIGAGCELLKDMKRLEGIVDAAVRTSNIPITVKMRLLPSIDDTLNVAKMFERRGIVALAVHGRTQKQKYGGVANWGILRQMKNVVEIPIIGNGDVWEAVDAKRFLKISGCDAVMVGRACLDDPFIFLKIKSLLERGEKLEFDWADKTKYLRQYFDLCLEYELPVIEAKERAVALVGEIRGAHMIKNKMTRAKDYEEIYSIFEKGVM